MEPMEGVEMAKAEPPVAVASTTGSLPRTSGEGTPSIAPCKDGGDGEVGTAFPGAGFKRPASQLRSPSPTPSTSTADNGSGCEVDEMQAPLSLGKMPQARVVRPGFAKLEGQDFDYYIQKYRISMGRNSSKGNVDLDLGDSSKNVSRSHADIKYHFAKKRWELIVHGKNGVFVNDLRHVPAGPVEVGVPLKSRDKLEVGGVEMYFLVAREPGAMPRPPSPPRVQPMRGTRTTRHGVHDTDLPSASRASRPIQALPSSLYEEILDGFIPGWTVEDKITGSNNIQRTFFAPWGERFRSFVGVQRAMKDRGHVVELPNAIAHQAAIRNEAIRRLDALLAQGKSLPPLALTAKLQSEWVQCSLCEKWRRTPEDIDGDRLPDDWCCEDIREWNPAEGSCSAPQEAGCPMVEDNQSPDKSVVSNT